MFIISLLKYIRKNLTALIIYNSYVWEEVNFLKGLAIRSESKQIKTHHHAKD